MPDILILVIKPPDVEIKFTNDVSWSWHYYTPWFHVFASCSRISIGWTLNTYNYPRKALTIWSTKGLLTGKVKSIYGVWEKCRCRGHSVLVKKRGINQGVSWCLTIYLNFKGKLLVISFFFSFSLSVMINTERKVNPI